LPVTSSASAASVRIALPTPLILRIIAPDLLSSSVLMNARTLAGITSFMGVLPKAGSK